MNPLNKNQNLLKNYSLFLSACVFVLIFAGGLVTSTGSGLSVPDWPLSYGMFFPPMIGGIRFEHSHRVIAGAIGVLTLIFTILVFLYESRRWVKNLTLIAMISVVVQAVLGGLTVIYLLPKPISISHACLGQTFFCMVAVIALSMSSLWKNETTRVAVDGAGQFQRLCLTTTVFIYLQLIMGAAVRHNNGHGLRYHILLAILVFIHALFTVIKAAGMPPIDNKLRWHALLLVMLVFTQVALGFVSYVIKFHLIQYDYSSIYPALLLTAHQANGALVLVTSLLLTLRSFRSFIESPKPPAKLNIRAYIELTKPKLTILAAAMTWMGYAMGLNTRVDWTMVMNMTVGAALIGGGANALNQLMECSIDSKMQRTKDRPLPSGQIDKRNVLLYSLALAGTGVLFLWIFVNWVSAMLGVMTLLTYIGVYTPLKQKTTFNTFFGAIPGALPTLIGFAAATGGSLDIRAFMVFMILFVWQLPHFFAIAWVYRDDYKDGGLKMFPSVANDQRGTALRIFSYTLILLMVTLLPYFCGFLGQIYLINAVMLGLAFLICSVVLCVDKLKSAKFFVAASIVYLPLLALALILDRLFL